MWNLKNSDISLHFNCHNTQSDFAASIHHFVWWNKKKANSTKLVLWWAFFYSYIFARHWPRNAATMRLSGDVYSPIVPRDWSWESQAVLYSTCIQPRTMTFRLANRWFTSIAVSVNIVYNAHTPIAELDALSRNSAICYTAEKSLFVNNEIAVLRRDPSLWSVKVSIHTCYNTSLPERMRRYAKWKEFDGVPLEDLDKSRIWWARVELVAMRMRITNRMRKNTKYVWIEGSIWFNILLEDTSVR